MNKFTNAANLPELLFDFSPDFRTSAVYNYTHILDTFAIVLADYRYKNGLSQKDLADMLQVSQSMISQYESAARNVSMKTLCDYCEKLGMVPHVSFEESSAPGRSEPADDILSAVSFGTFG